MPLDKQSILTDCQVDCAIFGGSLLKSTELLDYFFKLVTMRIADWTDLRTHRGQFNSLHCSLRLGGAIMGTAAEKDNRVPPLQVQQSIRRVRELRFHCPAETPSGC